MDTTQSTQGDLFDAASPYYYLAIVLLLIALFFIRKYLFRLDIYLNSRNDNTSGYVGKPWHVSWSLVLGLIFLLSQVISGGESERFNTQAFSVFLNDAHPWHWFWLVLILTEIGMMVVVVYQSITHFGMASGLARSGIIVSLMCLFFWSGMYMGLLFAAAIALFIIYKIFRLFYGRKKGLLTS